jgi:hypothetical protein
VKRIDIYYGGEHYSVGGRELDEVMGEIEKCLSGGDAHWLQVNDGEGAPRTAYLLITPGTPISIIPIPDDAPEPAGGVMWDLDGDEVRA